VLGWTPFGGPSFVRAEGLFPSVQPLAAAGNTLVFAADDGRHGTELWRSDGTEEGTGLFADIFPGSDSSWPGGITNVGGKLFFSANDGVHGAEPWRSDATAEGTRIIADVSPGASGSAPDDFTAVNAKVFFTADGNTLGEPLNRELWCIERRRISVGSQVRP
jgi:ELWxxDGT repeat protein